MHYIINNSNALEAWIVAKALKSREVSVRTGALEIEDTNIVASLKDNILTYSRSVWPGPVINIELTFREFLDRYENSSMRWP